MSNIPKIAIWFRYGPAEHAELFHAMPAIVAGLAQQAEVHYFGLASAKPIPPQISEHAIIHHLPCKINRASSFDILIKSLFWLMALPLIAIRCRRLGIKLVYIDETIPLTVMLGRLFFGRNIALTIADFLVQIYLSQSGPRRWLGRMLNTIDLASWRQLPLIFTRVNYTKAYLLKQGFDPSRIVPIYDPCDFTLYHPGDRLASRSKYQYQANDIVLVSHGIMHPNKANDRLIEWLAELRPQCPHLRLLLVGSGPDLARLRQLTTRLGLEANVRFTGWLPTAAQVNEALNAADIGIVMRQGLESDNFHVTGALVHSMACGLPILAARLGGVAEIVREDQCGFLFDPSSAAEFKAKLMLLTQSAERRQRLGAASYLLARKLFDIKLVAEQTVQALLEQLGPGQIKRMD